MYYDSGNGSHMYNAYGDTSCRSPVLTNGWHSSQHNDMNNGQLMTARNEQSSNSAEQPYYGRPSYHQSEPQTSPRLAFLYDRAYNAQPQPAAVTHQHSTEGATNNHRQSPERATRNVAREHYTNGNNESDIPPPLPTSLPPSCLSPSADSYAISRAMPAPMFQHGPKANESSHRSMTSAPATQQSAANIDRQMSHLALSDRHPPPAPGGATRHREVNGGGVRSRAMPTSFARRQSAPGPCLPPSSDGGKKQWALTPCGFTNSRGQHASVSNGRRTPSTPSDVHDGLYTPQSATPRTADGPKLLFTDSCQRNRSFGSQESFLDCDNTPQDNAAIDRSSIRHNLREGEEIGDYEQTSIRYTGKTNPSKIFRMLQTATGSDSENEVKQAQAAIRQQVRRRRPTQEELDEQHQDQSNADDIVDIAYVGSNIPSRTFRCLQEAIGTRAPEATEMEEVSQPRRSVRVIHLRPSIKKHSSMDNILCCSDL